MLFPLLIQTESARSNHRIERRVFAEWRGGSNVAFDQRANPLAPPPGGLDKGTVPEQLPDFDHFLHPGGMPEISRWLSAATPPANV